jgi:hypothetical protein
MSGQISARLSTATFANLLSMLYKTFLLPDLQILRKVGKSCERQTL